jgi:localization factor PodJL
MAEAAAKEAKGKASAVGGESAAFRLAAAGGRVTAFVAARKRPLLLGAALVVAVAAFAAIELRGPRAVPVPTQKSELRAPAPAQTPAQRGAVLELPKADALARLGEAAAIDPNPVGSILAPLTPAKTPAAVPTELAASIPAGAPQALRDAAVSGDASAALELALRLLDGRGVAKDARAAAAWLEQAAARDLAPAQYRLGSLYEKGVGVARDPALAVSWYAKAAAAGNARAMHNLAVMKAEGAVDGKPDYGAAAQWFRKAAELGVRDSQFNLGVLYARGMGAPQDYAQSWLWFSLAAQQGDSDAAKKRDEVAAKIDPAALAAAAKALAAFKVGTPVPAANEAPAPAGGWEAKSGPPQASLTPARAAATAL